MPDTSPTISPRVALVSGALPLGGSTIFLYNLAAEFVRRGIPAEVFSFERENPFATDFAAAKVPVFSQDERTRIFEDRLQNIFRELCRFKPTIVIANLSASSFEVLRYVPQGTFRVAVMHADQKSVYESLRHYASVTDLVAVVSEAIREKLAAMPEFAGVPIRYLPLGVPMPQEAKPRTFQNPLRVLYLGRLSQAQKRVCLFPEILAQLKASGIPFQWTIAGDGPESEWLKQAIPASAAPQAVSLRGPVSYAEVSDILDQHDIYLLASDYEGLPLSLLEAMGRGLVPVVSDLPSGIRELVDDTTGKRVALTDTKGYASAIVDLHHRRDEMERMSALAREKVRREFSVEAMADRWLNAFPKDGVPREGWPERLKIHPILEDPRSLYYSCPMRMLRRLALRFRK